MRSAMVLSPNLQAMVVRERGCECEQAEEVMTRLEPHAPICQTFAGARREKDGQKRQDRREAWGRASEEAGGRMGRDQRRERVRKGDGGKEGWT